MTEVNKKAIKSMINKVTDICNSAKATPINPVVSADKISNIALTSNEKIYNDIRDIRTKLGLHSLIVGKSNADYTHNPIVATPANLFDKSYLERHFKSVENYQRSHCAVRIDTIADTVHLTTRGDTLAFGKAVKKYLYSLLKANASDKGQPNEKHYRANRNSKATATQSNKAKYEQLMQYLKNKVQEVSGDTSSQNISHILFDIQHCNFPLITGSNGLQENAPMGGVEILTRDEAITDMANSFGSKCVPESLQKLNKDDVVLFNGNTGTCSRADYNSFMTYIMYVMTEAQHEYLGLYYGHNIMDIWLNH